jgi:hypothetical protein
MNDTAIAALPKMPAERFNCGPKAQQSIAPSSGTSQITKSIPTLS